jgi:hypothetical protein
MDTLRCLYMAWNKMIHMGTATFKKKKGRLIAAQASFMTKRDFGRCSFLIPLPQVCHPSCAISPHECKSRCTLASLATSLSPTRHLFPRGLFATRIYFYSLSDASIVAAHCCNEYVFERSFYKDTSRLHSILHGTTRSAAGQLILYILTMTQNTYNAAFHESNFYRFLDEDPKHGGDGLTNTIHPILRKEAFDPTTRYDVLIPSLRLATRLLTCDATAQYVATMFDGVFLDSDGKETTPEKRARLNQDIFNLSEDDRTDKDWQKMHTFAIPRSRVVSDETRARVAVLLDQMASFLTFGFDTSLSAQDDYDSSAYYDISSSPLPESLKRAYPEGESGIVRLLKSGCYTTMVKLTDEKERSLKARGAKGKRKKSRFLQNDRLIQSRFLIAQALFHEIGHAVQRMKFGNRSQEVYYDENKMAEAGFDLEASVFGGIITEFGDACLSAQGRKRLPAFYLKCWPSSSVGLLYLQNHHGVGWRLGNKIMPEVHHRIPMSYIASLFKDEFWERAIALRSQTAVHAPCVGSWAFILGKKSNGDFDCTNPAPMSWEYICNCYNTRRAFKICCIDGDNEIDLEPENVLETTSLNWLG